MNKSKIICTLGPASSDPKTLERIINAGMDIARLNFSHGEYKVHLENIKSVRMISNKLNKFIPVMQDLQGPKLRVGRLNNGHLDLVEGKEVFIRRKEIIGDGIEFSTTYKKFVDDVRVNEYILMDDGLLRMQVTDKKRDFLKCKVIKGGILKEHKGINLPNTKLSLPSLTEKDKKDLRFGLKHGVDAVALSFVRQAKDILELKKLIEKYGKTIPVVAKIERPEAIDNIDGIIEASDVIMVARGDMGVEISPEDVPILQKKIIRKCNGKLKPVITATQMLESMINNRIPTRAETTDVANAILDGTDCVMLSAETSVGTDPVNVVTTMENIIRSAENYRKPRFYEHKVNEIRSELHHICISAVRLASEINADTIVTFTKTGKSPLYLSNYRVNTDIISLTEDKFILTMNTFTWGVFGVLINKSLKGYDLVNFVKNVFKNQKFNKTERTIILSSSTKNRFKSADTIRIVNL
ncbi:MAG: pyruvate kinase [Ignavibacteria bacterium]|nr:pyruvate kinase [Ignavibacteria bacterium]